MVSYYVESIGTILIQKLLDSAGDEFLEIKFPGGKWEPAENYPQIDAWGIYWDFAAD